MSFLSPREAFEMLGARPELVSKQSQLMALFEARTGKRSFVASDGGVRTLAKQTALYADSVKQGSGKLAYPVGVPGSSAHEYGAAVDMDIVKSDSPTDADYRALASCAFAVGLVNRNGKAEYDPSDRGHFQLNESLATMKERWAALQKKNCSCSRSSSSSSSSPSA